MNLLIEFIFFVEKVYRHGDRNKFGTFPNDPYKDEKYWKGGLGELTNVRELLSLPFKSNETIFCFIKMQTNPL